MIAYLKLRFEGGGCMYHMYDRIHLETAVPLIYILRILHYIWAVYNGVKALKKKKKKKKVPLFQADA